MEQKRPKVGGLASLGFFGFIVLAWIGMSASVVPGFSSSPIKTTEETSDPHIRQIHRGYERLWQELDDAFSRAAESLTTKPVGDSAVLGAFQALAEIARQSDSVDVTLLLFDAQGNAVAWAGKGLLHDVAVARLPDRGRHHLASFSAVTLLVVQTLYEDASPWRLVVGKSLHVDRPPFPEGFESTAGESARWTVVSRTTPVDVRHIRVDLAGSPTLVVDMPEAASPSFAIWLSSRRSLVLTVSGFLLLMLSWRKPSRWILGFVGLATVAIGFGGSAWAIVLLLAGGLAIFGTWRLGPRLSSFGGAGLWGALTSIAAVGLCRLVQASYGPVDLGSDLIGLPAVWVARLAIFVVVLAMFFLVGPARQTATMGWSSWSGIALVPALFGAALFDEPGAATALLILAGILTALWCRGMLRPPTISRVGYLALLAAVISGTSWEMAFQTQRRSQAAGELLEAMAPPTDAEFDQMVDEVEAFLIENDLSDFSPARVTDLQRQDLAFEIWHHSPLSVNGAQSAIVVELPDGPPSSFSFGLPLNDDGVVEFSPLRWGLATLPVWKDSVFQGVTDLTLAGRPWARVRYWLSLAPGFRLAMERDEDLAAGLLRAGPRRREPRIPDLMNVEYGLYSIEGEPLLTPWRQAPRLSEALLGGGTGRMATPQGEADVATALGADGVRALFLPRPTAIAALERVGTSVLTCLLAATFFGLLVLLPDLQKQGYGSIWRRMWHSYSRRLVLVYSILILVPVFLLNLIVVRGLEERLRSDQEAAGESALESAQRVLGEYVLALEPGFGIDSAIDNQLLTWLSGVVYHDVNLYWKSQVYSSSKSELFKAGLLPRRIPGEIYSSLTLLNHEISSRTNRAGNAEYLELYAPLTIPGFALESARLFLSLPLLAQQEETAAQIASLRKGAVLGTATMMLILLVVGTRLARRFTTPLTEIVQGTQRIAAGESSLNLRPAELELAMLVDAIDQMASKIADGRQRLLREKRVVDRMVDNITSGVVSLDEGGQVLMANRIAVDMLGIQVGVSLDLALGDQGVLEPIRDFVAGASGRELISTTIKLEDQDCEQRDWSLVWVPLPGEGEPSTLLVVEEVTEVLRGQRLEAWAEMARMIAHEIKNPLTPIRLSAEHMQEIYSSDPANFAKVFDSCTANILRQVSALHEIAGEFSTYSRIPKIDIKTGDLVAAVGEIVDGYRSAPPKNIEVSFHTDTDTKTVNFDEKLIGRAVRNLIENAIRATASGGRVEVSVNQENEHVRIVVADTGSGVDPTVLKRIFDPYFSTHDAGTGLGLPIARRIAEEHRGTIAARNLPESGLEVVISLPAS